MVSVGGAAGAESRILKFSEIYDWMEYRRFTFDKKLLVLVFWKIMLHMVSMVLSFFIGGH